MFSVASLSDNPSMPPALSPVIAVSAHGILKGFGRGPARTMALKGVDFEGLPGELQLITGPSGCGKTTLMTLINNFQTIADNQTIYSYKPNIDYYKEFKVGGFISLTYTPFKVYKTKTVSVKQSQVTQFQMRYQ